MAGAKSILIIDDQERWRREVEELLVEEGYLVDTAGEFDEAVRKLNETAFDVVVVDRKFGANTERGLEIVKRLKRRNPAQELILLTNYLDQYAAEEVLKYDAFSALSKGDPDGLLSELRNVSLKQKLQLRRLPKPFDRSVLAGPKLPADPSSIKLKTQPPADPSYLQLKDQLASLEDPRGSFLELVVLAGILGRLGVLNRDQWQRMLLGTELAVRLPCLTSLSELSLQLFDDVAPQLILSLDLQERQSLCTSPTCIFQTNREAVLQLAIRVLLPVKRDGLNDGERFTFLKGLLQADFGVLPVVLQVAIDCLMNSSGHRELQKINTPALLHLQIRKYRAVVSEVLQLANAHGQAILYKRELLVLDLLRSISERYSHLYEIQNYPLEHSDWLEAFAGDIVPLMAEVRVLQSHQVAFPELVKSIDNCRLLLQRFNDKFVEFIWDQQRGYAAWVRTRNRSDRPMLTADVVREVVLPALERFRTVYFVIFDGMSLLSWMRIRDKLLCHIFDFEKDGQAMAVVPTATRFARSAIFAGKLPREFMIPGDPRNLDERQLLQTNLRELGASVIVSEGEFLKYEESHDPQKDDVKKLELARLLASKARLKVVIFDPHDKVTHLAPGFAEDFSELFYEKTVHQVMEKLSLLPDTAVVVTVDHGFCEIKDLKAVKGIFIEGNEKDGDYLYAPGEKDRRGHFGKRYIDLGARKYNERYAATWLRSISKPADWGLPESNGYLLAVGDCGFSLDAGRTRMFAHGGVSLEEMIVPVVVMRGKP